MKGSIELLTYAVYRAFLSDLIAQEKERVQSASARLFAKRLGLAPSTLSMVLDGKRRLSEEQIFEVAFALRLKGMELEYFENLVRFTDAETRRAKLFYKRRLERLRQDATQNSSPAGSHRNVDGGAEGLPGGRSASPSLRRIRSTLPPQFSDWYIFPLFLFMKDFARPFDRRRHVAEASRLFGVDATELEARLDALVELGVLELDVDQHVHLRFERLSGSFSQKRFFRSILRKIESCVESAYDRSDTIFLADALTLTAEHFGRFVEDYRRLVASYIDLQVDPYSEAVQQGPQKDRRSAAEIYLLSLQGIPFLRRDTPTPNQF